MLHIILLILKILGFLILVLAGLMLVAVITVLFAPAGYRFDLTAEEFGKSIFKEYARSKDRTLLSRI